MDDDVRRQGKELWERAFAGVALVLTAPLFLACAALIKLEALFDRDARGGVLFAEARVSRGEVFPLLKFRTLRRSALEALGDGPTHIAVVEKGGAGLTRAGRMIRRWYLDELPQLINIVRGDMGLVGTRPWPIELYDAEMGRGITRKRDMPTGLVGPVQAAKGDESSPDGLQLDLDYFEAYRSYPGWKLFVLDMRIIGRSLRVQMKHEGI